MPEPDDTPMTDMDLRIWAVQAAIQYKTPGMTTDSLLKIAAQFYSFIKGETT